MKTDDKRYSEDWTIDVLMDMEAFFTKNGGVEKAAVMRRAVESLSFLIGDGSTNVVRLES